jgi:hypothetical protein
MKPNFERDRDNLRSSRDSAHEMHFSGLPDLGGAWEALGKAVPTISAFAYLCTRALLNTVDHDGHSEESLSLGAKTILFLARVRGAIEVKVSPRAFRPSERFLAVHIVTHDDEEAVILHDPNELRVAVEFLDAFGELCRAGLCMHQLHGEFSLSHRGFNVAQRILREEIGSWLSKIQNDSPL